ncbi:MAG: bsaAI [Cyanobacteria bacterium]|nr:bsaAI [Cyanobacteria bacterium CG_2015-16_32_12]NCO78945.1 bsaAI [Cyanobacteria bacterium CG_2015-22_32_23]NCQ04966.1 bsaAI [Cyanobacteria bacterium CG_2015-09_32_10]NCQ43034.1 bsaAI [Cyanobacteria bacterium CG_2015-04_32_10]NCS83818.1 bsaAI [Cyanobacteria bacterium CG_2015-02_32_10]
MDTIGKEILQKLSSQGELRDKSPFSPFINGGIEVKATCGSVPSPSELRKKGLTKPDMGDTRIKMLKGYDWKAHHRETNNLIGLLWDFDNKIPLIIAIFFSSNLTENDWGKIVTPKEGGGRTTSVSIMPRDGVRKMYNNWILVRDDQRYINFLNKYNKSSLISK